MALDAHKALEAAKAIRAALEASGHHDADLLLDMLEGETSLFEQVDALLLANVEDAAIVDGIEAAQERLAIRVKRIKARVDARRTMLEQAMMIADQTRWERPAATLSLVPRKPGVIVQDEAEIPSRFWKPGAPSLDKKAIKEALSAGEDVPGATLSNQAPTLTIRST